MCKINANEVTKEIREYWEKNPKLDDIAELKAELSAVRIDRDKWEANYRRVDKSARAYVRKIDELADENVELEAERDRLREALEHIAMLERDFRSDPELYAGVDRDKAKVARKALEGRRS